MVQRRVTRQRTADAIGEGSEPPGRGPVQDEARARMALPREVCAQEETGRAAVPLPG